MPQLSKKQALDNIFSFSFSNQSGAAWKYMMGSLKWEAEDIPKHIAEAQFYHLWDNDVEFQSIATTWLSGIAIEMMDSVKAMNVQKPVKAKAVLFTESQLFDVTGKDSHQNKVKEFLKRGRCQTSDVATGLYGSNFSHDERKKVYMCLYSLNTSGFVIFNPRKMKRNIYEDY